MTSSDKHAYNNSILAVDINHGKSLRGSEMRHKVSLCCTLCLMVFFCIPTTTFAAKKILYIDSYFPNYQWSAGITAGIQSILEDREDVELKIFRMDTKRNQSEEYKKAIALTARDLINSWHPDLIIASDDNASKYLIAPWFKESDIPIVFCGLNWDASIYGFPTRNIIGMVEVSHVNSILDTLRPFARGDRIGFLASDTVTEHKEVQNISKRFDIQLTFRFVRTFDELKQAFLELQQETDMMLLQECRSVTGFNHKEMIQFVHENITIPTGTTHKFLMHYVLVTHAKFAREQGRYAAKTALNILNGTPPSEIPVTYNKKAAIYLNMTIARTLGIKFPMPLLENAHLISKDLHKVLYINSYHKGYQWSDDIEKGLLKALHIKSNADGSLDTSSSEVDFRLFRMDTKLNQSQTFIDQSVQTARDIIESWKPDIVVISDDNAAKHLIEPFYKNSSFPIIFCGLNWDASVYNFPRETIDLLKLYAKGSRLGYIGSDNLSNRKSLHNFKKQLGLQFSSGKLLRDLKSWKREYVQIQGKVDMLIWLTANDLPGWDQKKIHAFVLENTRIPTGSMAGHLTSYTLLGNVKIAAEQGWWAGKTVLRILNGTAPSAIEETTNKQSKLYLNMPLAKKMNIKFPMSLLEKATFIENQSLQK